MTRDLMKCVGALTVLFALGVSPVQAGFTLTFDDVTSTVSPSVLIPNGYGGFDWNDFAVQHRDGSAIPSSGYRTGVVSGDYAAFNTFGDPATISGNPFTFNSVYLTAAWNTGLNILVEGLVGNSVVYSQTVVVNTTGPTLFTFDYENITTLQFTSFGGIDAGLGGRGIHFNMDDATFNNAVNPIPAPPGLVLFAVGGLGLIGVRSCLRGKAISAPSGSVVKSG
jgi:hypothetical protein